MITPAQIEAEVVVPEVPLTLTQVENLILLVKQFGPYASAPSRWPNLRVKLNAELATPTVLTPILKAVLTAVNNLPEVTDESQGQEGSPGFFSVKANWDALAIDVLNAMYETSAALGPSPYGTALVRRPTESLAQKDRQYLYESETGRRY